MKIKNIKRAESKKIEKTSRVITKNTTMKQKQTLKREKWADKLSLSYKKPVTQTPKPILNLDSIQDMLPIVDVEQVSKVAGVKKAVTQKEKKKDALNEMKRMREVLKLSVFKSNPMATIQEHIRNTMPSK